MNTQLQKKCENFDFQELFLKKGYNYFTEGKYNLNIIGIRAVTDIKNKITNAFDDILVVIFKDRFNLWCREIYNITTDPGNYYMMHHCNIQGCAIVKEGQYNKLWQIGLHQNKYKALVQRSNITVYRDKNCDDYYDFEPSTEEQGIFGINLHRANQNVESKLIDKWSAGCQVFASPTKFNEFLALCDAQITNGMGKYFTYTLLNENDLTV